MSSCLHYTDNLSNKTRILEVGSHKKVAQLYRYAVSCATADVVIELVRDGSVIRSHQVIWTMPKDIADVLDQRPVGKRAH